MIGVLMVETNNALNKNRRVGNYVFDMNTDLKLVFLFSLAFAASQYITELGETILMPVFSLIMLFFVPGFAFTAALFPGNRDIDLVERTALSFGLSICLYPLIELALSYTPWGLRLTPLAISLAAFTCICAMAATVRRHRLKKADRFFIDFKNAYKDLRGVIFSDKTSYDRALTFLLVIAIVLAGSMVAYAVFQHKPVDKFTEFYVLGPNNTTDSYPTDFINGSPQKVFVGIVNHEDRAVNYDLVILINKSDVIYPLYHEDNIAIGDNQSWGKSIDLTPTQTGAGMRLEFLLYADGNRTTPYRECHFRINVNGTS
jgi:uncharacterized membrane protein